MLNVPLFEIWSMLLIGLFYFVAVDMGTNFYSILLIIGGDREM